MTDVRGVKIEVGDTVAAAYRNYDTEGAGLEVAVVYGINILNNTITFDDGDPIPLDTYEVIVLPSEYKDW